MSPRESRWDRAIFAGLDVLGYVFSLPFALLGFGVLGLRRLVKRP